jgi:ribonucleoside-diphosphate reductase alpha chain
MSEQDYYWLNKDSRKFLKNGYLEDGVEPEQRVRQIAETAEKYLKLNGFADKFEEYMKRGFYSLATPVWCNFGLKRGLPISCFGSDVQDTMESILFKAGEVGYMSKVGGGTSAYFGNLRGRGAKISIGGESNGPVAFMEIFDAIVNTCNQGSARRGNMAAYLDVDHPDIKEFLKIRSDGNSIQNLLFGVCISNKWMEEMIAGDKDKRSIWAEIIKCRYERGLPYIFFTDNANNFAPKHYSKHNKKIKHSNLCTEIMLSNGVDESFVCCLSSLNLVKWTEIKDTDAIETLTMFLDSVMEEFIKKTNGMPFMEHARNFAVRQRALGLGVLGWHSLLQSKNIAMESMDAKYLNSEIFETISKKTLDSTKKLAIMFGEPELMSGTGLRNATTIAVAPTTSSSFILGQVSPSIEPLNSNYFVKKLAKGSFTFKNPYLKECLNKHDKNNQETWNSIMLKGGSVQHLDFLTEHEKNVFKTFAEISQMEIVIQAAQRQRYIDQGQSLNVMIAGKTPAKETSNLLIEGWKLGIKSFYYQRSTSPAQELSRSNMECVSCAS